MQQHAGTKGAIAKTSTLNCRLAFCCGSAAVRERHAASTAFVASGRLEETAFQINRFFEAEEKSERYSRLIRCG
jgi:hypothetical protein